MPDVSIKSYSGSDPEIAKAVTELEDFIGEMENLELADDSTVYVPEAVAALNVLIERLNR